MLITIIIISKLLVKFNNLVHKVTLDMYGRSVFRHIQKIVKSENVSFVMSACLSVRTYIHMDDPSTTECIFMKNDIWVCFENLLRRINFDSNVMRIMCTLHEDVCTLLLVSCWIFLRMRNVADKSCRENHNIHFMFNKFFSKNRVIYGIMWKNMVQQERSQI